MQASRAASPDLVTERWGIAGAHGVHRTLPPPPGACGEQRYRDGALLGSGGMGDVHACEDLRIGRTVARKTLRAHDDVDGARRFIAEARLQGQLEHPAIVPVYELGTDEQGTPFFTMKRVRGRTLAAVLADTGGSESNTWSMRRLLGALSTVALAVDYAHGQGVVHGDLKPQNVMLGRFGEVHVLDWGCATEAVDDSGERAIGSVDLSAIASDGDDHAIVGTPGYLAPEQAHGVRGLPASDVYALGAILFEILTLQKLHTRPSVVEQMAATLVADDSSPIERTPERDIAPELDRVCREATRLSPEQRTTSASALAKAIDAYLDGDRDLALRRELARGHAERAEAALMASHAPDSDEPTERASAMREVSAALALDTTHGGARATLVRLITEPPRNVPAEAQAEIDANHRRTFHLAARSGVGFYLGYFAYLPFLLWMGVRDWQLFAFGWVVIALCALTTLAFVLRPPRNIDVPLVHLAISTFSVAAVSVMFGPFVLVPMLALGNAVAYIASVGHARGLVPLATCLAVIVPVVLRATGVLPDTYVFENDAWTILPSVFHMKPVATQVFLLVAIVGTLVPACMFVARLRQSFTDAELRLQLQAWQLRQIVPEAPEAETAA